MLGSHSLQRPLRVHMVDERAAYPRVALLASRPNLPTIATRSEVCPQRRSQLQSLLSPPQKVFFLELKQRAASPCMQSSGHDAVTLDC